VKITAKDRIGKPRSRGEGAGERTFPVHREKEKEKKAFNTGKKWIMVAKKSPSKERNSGASKAVKSSKAFGYEASKAD